MPLISHLTVCEHCVAIVPPDRDRCPNSATPQLVGGPLHRLVTLVPEERDAPQPRSDVQPAADAVLASIEAAKACLEAAKAGLR